MPNFSVITYQAEDKAYQKVAADMETRIETIDNAKAIRHWSIVYRRDEGTFVGTLVYDA